MPSDRLSTSIDVFYSEFEEDQQLKGIEVPLQWGGAGESLSNSTVNNGLVTSGTFDETYFVGRNDILLRESELLSAGWNNPDEAGTDLVKFSGIMQSILDLIGKGER